MELEKRISDLEDRLHKTLNENENLQNENQGLSLKQQNYEKLQMNNKKLEQIIFDLEKENGDVRREKDKHQKTALEKEQNHQFFVSNEHKPLMEKHKLTEAELEKWRTKCMALESNFNGD